MSHQDYDPRLTDRIPIEETERLISSSKVEGTPVYDLQGEPLGHIESLMLDKLSGRVAYAVLSFGGILGLREHHYPLPWSLLTYNKDMRGYVVDLDHARLEEAPRHGSGDEPAYDRPYGERIHSFWQAPYPF